jgi:PKD repeat protein
VTASTAVPGTYVGLDLRYRDATGASQAARKSLRLDAAPQTFRFEPADMGLPAGVLEMVSVRLMLSADDAPVTLHRVSVYATNGVDARNLHVLSGGDDVLVSGGEAAFLAPGADGKYTFLVGMAADGGDFLPTVDAWVCLYAAEQVLADRGFPSNNPQACGGAFLPASSPAVVKTREGDAFRFDVDAQAVRPPAGFSGAVALYAIVEADGAYDDAAPGSPEAWKTGYFSLARVAADKAGAGVSNEFYTPTPIFVDGDADGTPDYVQTDETDHYAAIVTPQRARATPAATLVTPTAGAYEFAVEVYRYPSAPALAGGAPPTGSPMTLDARGVGFALFDATLLTSGEQPDFAADALWLAGEADVQQVSPTEYRVRVPVDEVPGDRVVGAWAYYDVAGGDSRRTAFEGAFGPSDSAFDFYSSVQTAAKAFAFADGLRSHATPLVLDSASATADATLVLRKVGDDVTYLDGTVLVDAGADGKVSFEYALVLGDGTLGSPAGHGFALYDAGGLASDGFAPGTARLAHAEWTGQGTPGAEGWFRIDAPESAFANAKGPVAAWAYADAPGLSRSGYYNLLKPTVAVLSTSAAERALYPATPVVLVDSATGLPADLSAALEAVPGLAGLGNPLVNPGFEADMLVEGRKDTNDNTGAAMTSPPWFFRLDDKGTGQSTRAASTHEVVKGAGRMGGNALGVQYYTLDAGKGLMLGQLLGVEDAKAAFVWEDAAGVAFDVKNAQQPLHLDADVKYLADDGAVRTARASFDVPVASGWQRVQGGFPVPAEGKLLGLYLLPRAAGTSYFLLDNVALLGSRTALGDTRTDLTDGHAVIIEPSPLSGTTLQRTRGATGQFYLFNVSLVAYGEDGAARQVDLADVDGLSFGLRTSTLAKDLGQVLRLRARTDIVTAVLPLADAPATPAAPWAFLEAGTPYFPLGNPAYAMQPASGYFSPVKNALRADPLADRLDYAGTPVTFDTNAIRNYGVDQRIQLFGDASSGYRVFVTALTPFIETTTLTVSGPSGVRAFPVTLDSALGNEVAGLLVTASELPGLTFTTAPTLFARGATVVAGEPVAAIEGCRVDELPVCAIAGVPTGQAIRFTDRTVVPGGEAYARSWSFGDGSTPQTGASVDHAFSRPGAYTVTLDVTTASGKTSRATFLVEVANRGPTALGLDVTPAAIYVDSPNVKAQARASDPDHGTLSYKWSIEGVEVLGKSGPVLALTPDVLAATTASASLVKGVYDIAYAVTDGQGGEDVFASTFEVRDHSATAEVASVEVVGFPEAAYALPGETIRVRADAADVDDAITGVVAHVTKDAVTLSLPMTQEGASWVADATLADLGAYAVTVEATSAGGSVTSAPVAFEVREDSAPLAVLGGPALLQAFQAGVFSSAGSADPDGRGALSYEWLVDGVPAGTGADLAFDATPATVGTHAVELRVADATGLASTVAATLQVDDVIRLTLTVTEGDAATPATATLRVVDERGNPVAGATVDWEDFLGPVPAPLATGTLVTDETGTATWDLSGPAVLPLGRRVEVHVEAASHAGAPVQDVEQADAAATYGASVLP